MKAVWLWKLTAYEVSSTFQKKLEADIFEGGLFPKLNSAI